MKAKELPLIGITMGDPAGIGAEVIVKVLSDSRIFEICRPLVLGDIECISRAIEIVKADLKVEEINQSEVKELTYKPGEIKLINLSKIEEVKYGYPNKSYGEAVVKYLKEAVHLALKGKIDAITTAPINKKAMAEAGYPYPGHTELLAELTGCNEYAMMLMGDKLKVVPITIHCALRDVPTLLNPPLILRTIKITQKALRDYFNIDNPKIAVAALNPHAGEGGIFGQEEEEVIIPAIRKAQDSGINVFGPHPADTLFFAAFQGAYDVVLCMYHDQALIPLKLLHFGDAVNITLGLPIIRTSVDHGTAYEIAGTGKASPNSLFQAIKWAAYMVIKKRK